MKSCTQQESDRPEADQIGVMLAFLPELSADGFCPGGVIPLEADGFPTDAFAALATRFMDACYKCGMVVKFKWEQWDQEALRLVQDPGALAAADFPLLRRLLTWHVRQNRFDRTHLGTVIANGHILAILQRMQALH